MLKAQDIMTCRVATVRPEASVNEAIDLMLSHEISGMPVTDDDGQLVGIITEFAMMAMVYDVRVCEQTVGEHMTTDVYTVEADDPISKVADLCLVHRVRRVPVMQSGHLVGLIARRDVLKALYQSHAPICAS